MTDSLSVRARDFRVEDYSDNELDAIRKDAALDQPRKDAQTGAVMNDVRKRAGYREADVPIRGDDKSDKQLRKEWEHHDMKHAVIGTSTEQIPEMAAGTILEAAAPLLFAYHAVDIIKTAWERGDARSEAMTKGEMHLAMLTAIDVPQGYKNIEIDKWKTSVGDAAGKMGTRLEVFDRDKAAVLQVHADRGMHGAERLIERGLITRSGDATQVAKAVAQDPAIKARYDADPAFRAGLDGFAWAMQHDTPAYDKARSSLQARDARYTQHHITIGG